MAGAVITGLTNNPAFPAPTVDLKAVQTAADGGFQAAAMTRARTPLGNPSILSVDLENSTELVRELRQRFHGNSGWVGGRFSDG